MHMKVLKYILAVYCLFLINHISAMRKNNFTWTISTFDNKGFRWDIHHHKYEKGQRNYNLMQSYLSHQQESNYSEQHQSNERSSSSSSSYHENDNSASLVDTLRSFLRTIQLGVLPVEAVNVDVVARNLESNNILCDTYPHVQSVVDVIVMGMQYTPFYCLYEKCLHAVYANNMSLSALLNGFYHVSQSHGVASPEYDAHMTKYHMEEYLRIKTMKAAYDMLCMYNEHMPSLMGEYTSEMPVREKLLYDITMNIVAHLDIDAIYHFYHDTLTKITPPHIRIRAMYAYASMYASTPEVCFSRLQKHAFDQAFRQYLNISCDTAQSTLLNMNYDV